MLGERAERALATVDGRWRQRWPLRWPDASSWCCLLALSMAKIVLASARAPVAFFRYIGSAYGTTPLSVLQILLDSSPLQRPQANDESPRSFLTHVVHEESGNAPYIKRLRHPPAPWRLQYCRLRLIFLFIVIRETLRWTRMCCVHKIGRVFLGTARCIQNQSVLW